MAMKLLFFHSITIKFLTNMCTKSHNESNS